MTDAVQVCRQGLADAERNLAAAERQVDHWRAVLAALGEPEQQAEGNGLAELVEECGRRGIPVIREQFVSERNAAKLVGLSYFTLRNRRQQFGEPIAPVTLIEGATHYSLADIGVHLRGHTS